ncbi:MAG: hypothetical protein WCT07_01905 [Candidatus Paceibacterota bacterium]
MKKFEMPKVEVFAAYVASIGAVIAFASLIIGVTNFKEIKSLKKEVANVVIVAGDANSKADKALLVCEKPKQPTKLLVSKFKAKKKVVKKVSTQKKEEILTETKSNVTSISSKESDVKTPSFFSKTETCQGSCSENVAVIREEKRTDGRCFVQTNMGYKFELRANASNGRLMVGLVNPQTDKLVDGIKGMYVGNLQASHDPKGVNCDGMQSQLYQNWEAVRSAYGIPSTCQLTEAKKD